ncbi:MAG: hypothetical protein KGJ06_02800 [Pseudomonadota bacterium]|nr:hypothetical protein [Pseudomonadota bacterium]
MNKISTLALLMALGFSAPVFAQNADTNVPGHPRVNEIDNRLQDQQNRINAGEANGTMTQGQAARDEKRDERVAAQESKDEAKHNGHLTKREQRKLNKELNKDSKDIHQQKARGKRKERREEHHEENGQK